MLFCKVGVLMLLCLQSTVASRFIGFKEKISSSRSRAGEVYMMREENFPGIH